MSRKIGMMRASLLFVLLALLEMQHNVNGAPMKHLEVTADGKIPKLIVTSVEDFGSEPKRLVVAKSKPPITITTTTSNSISTPIPRQSIETIDGIVGVPNEQQHDMVTKKSNTLILTKENPLNFIDTATTPLTAKIASGITTTTMTMTMTPTPTPTKMTSVEAQTQTSLEPIIESRVKYTSESDDQDKLGAVQVRKSEKYIKLSLATTLSPVATLTTLTPLIPLDKFQHQQIITTTTTTTTTPSPSSSTEFGELLIAATGKHSVSNLSSTSSTLQVDGGVTANKEQDKNDTKKTTTTTTTTYIDSIKSTPTSTIETTPKKTLIVAPTNIAKQDMAAQSIHSYDQKKILTSLETLGKTIKTSSSNNMDIMLNEQPADADAVKLFDLEKTANNLSKFQHETETRDMDIIVVDGHDGVKKTKKKQLLIDKQILADIGVSTPQPPPVTATPLRRTTATTQFVRDNFTPKVKKSDTTKQVEKYMKYDKMAFKAPVEAYIESHFSNEDKKHAELKKFNSQVKTTKHAKQQPPIEKSSTTPASSDVTRKILAQRTESKISDIQVEVYDSTVDSIVASTNFKDNAGQNIPQDWYAPASTKKPVVAASSQARFTQYVVDAVESSTQESHMEAAWSSGSYDKPEPAAIEIHINVSEGVGNGSEDLEFSYPQLNYENNKEKKLESRVGVTTKQAKAKSLHDDTKNVSDEDEVLVVEIIDTGDNNTANSASAENTNPIFTFRSVAHGNEVEFKNYSDGTLKTSIPLLTSTDELFMANMQKYGGDAPSAPTPHVRKPNMDHDSDTIFYISNTEVKVGESLPTANLANELTNADSRHASLSRHRFEEDILLSPLHNTADALKIFRNSQHEADAPPLDVTYVAESVMKVEQLPTPNDKASNLTLARPLNNSTNIQTPGQVIIQPATLSEIGLPVIGELPPQIKLKEFDFMPDELTNHESPADEGAHEDGEGEEEEAHVNINDVERLVESSMQYGGDLIDEGAVSGGSSFDGVEASYPFANLATMGRHGNKNVKSKYSSSQIVVNHGVNNLRKNELSVDMNESGGTILNITATKDANATKDNLDDGEESVGGGVAALNITYAVAERMINTTPASLMENVQMSSMNIKEDYYWGIFSLTASTLIASIPVATIFSMFFVVRYFYNKYQLNSNDSSENDFSREGGNEGKTTANGNPDNEADGDDSESTQLQTSPSSHISNPNPTYNSSTSSATCSQSSSCSIISGNYAHKSGNVELADIVHHHYTPPRVGDVDNFQLNRSNGSVIKMTLKNNHLMVETEQRHDMSRNMRETKMHYSNGTGRDGVFVVEVSRGIDAQHMPTCPLTEREQSFMKSIIGSQQQRLTLLPDNKHEVVAQQEKAVQEEVQIHQPPRDVEKTEEKSQVKLQQIAEDEEEATLVKPSYTGLSQSDLSSSSSSGSNKCYTYGNQSLYTDEFATRVSSSPQKPLLIDQADKHIEPATLKVASSGDKDGYDSLISLPAPPSSEEIKQLNESTPVENNQLDSLSLPPPPPPPTAQSALAAPSAELYSKHNEEDMLSAQLTPPESPPHKVGICGEVTAVAVTDVNCS